jgi:hypothetical protein
LNHIAYDFIAWLGYIGIKSFADFDHIKRITQFADGAPEAGKICYALMIGGKE